VNGAIQTVGAVGRIPAFQDTSGVKLFLETLFVSSHEHDLKQLKIIVKPMLEKPVDRDSVEISVLHGCLFQGDLSEVDPVVQTTFGRI